MLETALDLGLPNAGPDKYKRTCFYACLPPLCEENLCGNMGELRLPPDCGTAEEMRQKALRCRGVVMQSMWDIEDPWTTV